MTFVVDDVELRTGGEGLRCLAVEGINRLSLRAKSLLCKNKTLVHDVSGPIASQSILGLIQLPETAPGNNGMHWYAPSHMHLAFRNHYKLKTNLAQNLDTTVSSNNYFHIFATTQPRYSTE